MTSFLGKVVILVSVAFVVAAEFDFRNNPKFDARKNGKGKGKRKGKATKRTAGALGQGFEIAKIDLLGKQLQATGAKIFKSLPLKRCTKTDKLGSTQRDDKFYTTTESLYQSVSTDSKVEASLEGPYTLGVSVAAVTNNIVSGNTEVSGLSLNLKAYSLSTSLSQDCINRRPLVDPLVNDFEALDKEVKNPWLVQSWRGYNAFLDKFGSHIVRETLSGSSIYQYVFAKSTEKFSQRDFTVTACASLAGPTNAGKVGVSACSGVSKEESEASSKTSMVKKLVVRGGTADTRADLTGELTPEQITKFLKEGQSDPSPIQYGFYPIWTILKTRYLGTEHYAKAANLEQYYKGFLSFGCHYQETSNKKELQKFVLTKDSDPEAPTYACMLAPEGCHVDDDCSYRAAFWCECAGESCVRYRTLALNSGSKKKEAYANTASSWGWQGCELDGLACYCTAPRKDWQVSWSGDLDSALSDVNSMMLSARRRRNETAMAYQKRCKLIEEE